MNRLLIFGLALVLFISMQSCNEKATPRPYGYFRVDLPQQQYQTANLPNFPYSFEVNRQVKLIEQVAAGEPFWIDVFYPELNATLYCSYKSMRGNLFELSEDSRKIVYKHSVRADEISEQFYENREKKVFGILYELSGNVASPIQFVLTDSSHHFFRAALYFENTPNSDSIAPVLQYLNKDIIQMVESFEWR